MTRDKANRATLGALAIQAATGTEDDTEQGIRTALANVLHYAATRGLDTGALMEQAEIDYMGDGDAGEVPKTPKSLPRVIRAEVREALDSGSEAWIKQALEMVAGHFKVRGGTQIAWELKYGAQPRPDAENEYDNGLVRFIVTSTFGQRHYWAIDADDAEEKHQQDYPEDAICADAEEA